MTTLWTQWRFGLNYEVAKIQGNLLVKVPHARVLTQQRDQTGLKDHEGKTVIWTQKKGARGPFSFIRFFWGLTGHWG